MKRQQLILPILAAFMLAAISTGCEKEVNSDSHLRSHYLFINSVNNTTVDMVCYAHFYRTEIDGSGNVINYTVNDEATFSVDPWQIFGQVELLGSDAETIYVPKCDSVRILFKYDDGQTNRVKELWYKSRGSTKAHNPLNLDNYTVTNKSGTDTYTFTLNGEMYDMATLVNTAQGSPEK